MTKLPKHHFLQLLILVIIGQNVLQSSMSSQRLQLLKHILSSRPIKNFLYILLLTFILLLTILQTKLLLLVVNITITDLYQLLLFFLQIVNMFLLDTFQHTLNNPMHLLFIRIISETPYNTPSYIPANILIIIILLPPFLNLLTNFP